MSPAKRPTKSTAARPKLPGGPTTRPGGVPLKRDHVEQGRQDVERGVKDTASRVNPRNVPRSR